MPGKYVMLNPDRVNLCGEWDPATVGRRDRPKPWEGQRPRSRSGPRQSQVRPSRVSGWSKL